LGSTVGTLHDEKPCQQNLFEGKVVHDESLDVKVEDEDKAILLVVSLSLSYKFFKEIMPNSNFDSISFEDVKSNLLSKKKFDHDINANSATSLVVRGRPTDKGGNGGRRKNRSKSRNPHACKTYNYCGKLSHIVANFRKLKNKEKEEKENQSKKLATADYVVGSESDCDVLVATMSRATTS